MRGPLLSGPLGSASTLEALLRRLDGAASVVVIGPLWLGKVLSTRLRVLLLTDVEDRPRARSAARRATTAGHRLSVAVAGVDLPVMPGSVEALVVESASTLEGEAMARWLASLVPVLRPGGRLLALDATDNPAVEARLAGLFLGAALTHIAQDRPRDGVVLTVGTAPPAAVVARRFVDPQPPGSSSAPVT